MGDHNMTIDKLFEDTILAMRDCEDYVQEEMNEIK